MLRLRFIFIALFFCSCLSKQRNKKPVLLADREAPLGWVHLKLYSDSSFEFISSGLRGSNVYPGRFTLHEDSLFLQYTDSIPQLRGFKAIISKTHVSFIEATYPEEVEIKLNELKILKKSPNKFSNQDNLKIAKEFAESYLPDSIPNKGVEELRDIPDSVVYAFRNLDNKEAKEKYLVLIFLKLYRSHMQCCHQSYDLRTKFSNKIDSITDPLLFEYNLVTKQYTNDKPIEFIPSFIAERWVDSHPYLLKYQNIQTEYNKIKKVEDSIVRHLYWK